MLAINLARGNLRGFRDFSEVAKISCYKAGQVFTRHEEKATYGIKVRFKSS